MIAGLEPPGGDSLLYMEWRRAPGGAGDHAVSRGWLPNNQAGRRQGELVQAVQIVSNIHKFSLTGFSIAACLLLAGCGRAAPQRPAVVDFVLVSIDADNNCSMAGRPVECGNVAAAIRARYPGSHPRVDICLEQASRYEASVEVMRSLKDGAMPLGDFSCDKAPAR